MLLYYYDKKTKNIPRFTESKQIDIGNVKAELKEYLNKMEGEEFASVAVFDQYIGDSDRTFADYFINYLNLNVFKVHIIDPKKLYVLPNALEFNVHLGIDEKNIMAKVKMYKNKNGDNIKVHLVDDFLFTNVDANK